MRNVYTKPKSIDDSMEIGYLENAIRRYGHTFENQKPIEWYKNMDNEYRKAKVLPPGMTHVTNKKGKYLGTRTMKTSPVNAF
jgi:hypothetical protein